MPESKEEERPPKRDKVTQHLLSFFWCPSGKTRKVTFFRKMKIRLFLISHIACSILGCSMTCDIFTTCFKMQEEGSQERRKRKGKKRKLIYWKKL